MHIWIMTSIQFDDLVWSREREKEKKNGKLNVHLLGGICMHVCFIRCIDDTMSERCRRTQMRLRSAVMHCIVRLTVACTVTNYGCIPTHMHRNTQPHKCQAQPTHKHIEIGSWSQSLYARDLCKWWREVRIFATWIVMMMMMMHSIFSLLKTLYVL